MITKSYPKSSIEVFKPAIGEQEIDAVAQVMRSGWIGAGPKVEEFEQAWARHIGVARECVVSVGCATEALFQVMWEIAGNGMFGKGSTVIIPDNSFIGTAAAVLESGMKFESSMSVKVCDIDRQTLNPTALDYSNAWAPNVAALVYQHYGGFQGQRNAVEALCFGTGTALVEDFACHPLGKPVGDFAIYSFDAMKVLTCGDGGMVYCNNVESANWIRQATRLGMDTASGQSSGAANWWEFTAHTPGRRSMMNDIGAAIGLVQLGRLGEMVGRRRAIWVAYQAALAELDWLTLPPEPDESVAASYYTFWLACEADGVRDALAHYLRERGVYTTYRYYSVSRAYGWDVAAPNSHWASDHVLNLPLHPGLSDDDVSYVCETVAEFGRTLGVGR